MKYLILLLPVVAFCQEAPSLEGEPISVQEVSESDMRATTPQILTALYRSEEVRAQCLKTPDKPIDVTLNGYKVPLECSIWNRWNEAEQRRIREAAEAAEAEAP